MNKTTNGFTIVELVIVITLIAILSTVATISYTSILTSTRDEQRRSKTTAISDALEKFYEKNGEYPGCTAMREPPATVVSTTLKNITPDTLTAPTADSGTNSITCSDISGPGDDDVFAYVGSGSICSSGNACVKYTLKYREEGTSVIKTIVSRKGQ